MEQQEIITNEDILGPRKTDLTYVGLIAIGSVVSGFIGWVVTLLFIFFFASKTTNAQGIYAYLFSMGGFFTSTITVFMTLWMNKVIAPDKYRQGITTFTQVAIFSILLYIFMLPLYIYLGAIDNNVIYIFVGHVLLSILGNAIITEVLSNYRYVLLGLYGSFAGFLATAGIVTFFYLNTTNSKTALFGLIGVVIVANCITHVIRALLEFAYYQLYAATGSDKLGDIFYQIESEEKELVTQAKKNLEKF